MEFLPCSFFSPQEKKIITVFSTVQPSSFLLRIFFWNVLRWLDHSVKQTKRFPFFFLSFSPVCSSLVMKLAGWISFFRFCVTTSTVFLFVFVQIGFLSLFFLVFNNHRSFNVYHLFCISCLYIFLCHWFCIKQNKPNQRWPLNVRARVCVYIPSWHYFSLVRFFVFFFSFFKITHSFFCASSLVFFSFYRQSKCL